MAVYFFTLHAYRSWRPDNKRGYVRRKQGILPPDPKTAAEYAKRAKHEQVQFTTEIQNVMIHAAHDICQRREWRLHAVGFEPTHGHFLVSWHGFTPWLDVRAKLKNILSLILGRYKGAEGRPWFSDGGSRKRVTTPKHFSYLIGQYIPKHSGQKWFEGDSLPPIPDHILNPQKRS